ncbi:MAG: hypothetical protein M3Q99_12735 [Acidobacteriota bacterium]|nr:hypothetical protein [Acidobacteriota bacterium]
MNVWQAAVSQPLTNKQNSGGGRLNRPAYRNPVKLLSDYMKECLEIWEHERLDDEISKEAQKSGYTEDDAVELVRQYRREKRENAAS